MKVVMITTFPVVQDHIIGGVAGVSYYLIQELNRIEGVEIEVIAPEAPLDKEQSAEFDGVPVHYLPLNLRLPVMVRWLYATPRAIRRKLSELNYDLIHVQGVTSWSCNLKSPHLLTIHGITERDILHSRGFTWLKSQLVRLIESRARRRVKHVIVINPYVLHELSSDLLGQTCQIDNPVADSFFEIESYPIPGRLLYGGLIVPRKNIKGLIKAFSLVLKTNPGSTLRLAGSGADSPYGQECKALVRELGLEQNMNFLGQLSIEEMQKEMSRACCLVLCSYQETAPVIISEAMAIGLPVVASNICGMPYMVVDGQTGKLVDPNDPLDISAGINYVLKSENLTSMSQQARNIANERFRASVVARKTYDFYKSILAGQ